MITRTIGTWITSLCLTVAFVLGCSRGAQATWLTGDEITHAQGTWGDSTSAAGILLVDKFNTVYLSTFGALEVGIPGTAGFSMTFSGAPAVLDYLPQIGAVGPLISDYADPTNTTSGAFGGEVTALQLNVDYSDAGFLVGSSGIPFGDLILANFSGLGLPLLDGLTVRQFLADTSMLLGGGLSIYGIADLYPVNDYINFAFNEGVPDTFAQDHLVAPTTVASQVPEPSTLLLFASSLLLLGSMRRFRRQ